MLVTSFSSMCVSGTVLEKLMPPVLFFLKYTCGGVRFKRMPTASSSRVKIALWCSVFVASRTCARCHVNFGKRQVC